MVSKLSKFARAHLDADTTVPFRDAAQARGQTVHELATEIINTIAREDLFDAVLDDGGAA
ncbi:hypothetical protein [Sphingorhabdus sp. 109]|uniref:hypothetical protein n=1 Tax=Sphingorhabdus sp. 109 TaxID=2653173 RepID=UPI00135CD0AC|nr:hypothetical protein [Sphingorhabdus sp. 109]